MPWFAAERSAITPWGGRFPASAKRLSCRNDDRRPGQPPVLIASACFVIAKAGVVVA